MQYKDYFILYFAFTLLKMVVNPSGPDTTDLSAHVDGHRHTVKHTICHVIIIPFQDAFSKPYFYATLEKGGIMFCNCRSVGL